MAAGREAADHSGPAHNLNPNPNPNANANPFDLTSVDMTTLRPASASTSTTSSSALIDAIYVFVAPPSYEELGRRLRGRGTETAEKVAVRLANAKIELEAMQEPGLFDYVITNDDVDEAALALRALAFRAWCVGQG